MHHFETEMCTHVHILLQNTALWDVTGALWDLIDRFITHLWKQFIPHKISHMSFLQLNYNVI